MAGFHCNKIQCLYDRHHKVSARPNLQLNMSNSVKHEGIRKREKEQKRAQSGNRH